MILPGLILRCFGDEFRFCWFAGNVWVAGSGLVVLISRGVVVEFLTCRVSGGVLSTLTASGSVFVISFVASEASLPESTEFVSGAGEVPKL